MTQSEFEKWFNEFVSEINFRAKTHGLNFYSDVYAYESGVVAVSLKEDTIGLIFKQEGVVDGDYTHIMQSVMIDFMIAGAVQMTSTIKE